MALGHVLAQETIDADDPRRTVGAPKRFVDHDQMVAHAVEGADVAADDPGGGIGRNAALFEENPIAQLLRPPDLLLARCEARLERPGARQHWAKPGKIAFPGNRRRRPRAPSRGLDANVSATPAVSTNLLRP